MSYFAVNLVLAFVWAALNGVDLANLWLGFLLGYGVLALSAPFLGSGPYVRSGLAVIRLLVVFVYELIVANVRLARDVLRRHPRFDPAFLRIDVTDLGPAQAATLGALVSLTPGSITVDISADGDWLYMHTVYAHHPDEARRQVRAIADRLAQIGGRPVAKEVPT